MPLSTTTTPRTVAIVGGGITGACVAAELSRHHHFRVLLFDQGRRGPGGRASHRSVQSSSDNTADTADEVYQFDHGCQFFRADSHKMQTLLLQPWLEKKWVAPWKARMGALGGTRQTDSADFFGLPGRAAEPVYIGVGGMHMLPRRILQHSNDNVQVYRGTRVSCVRHCANGGVSNNSNLQWELMGVSGTAAYHDTDESESKLAPETVLATADAVVFTDISSASESWHRASAGIPDSLRNEIPDKVRLPLFTCMVALDTAVGDQLPYDAFTTASDGDDILWFAAKSQSKPGFPRGGAECWTLISTPAYAVNQIRQTNMRDPVTGVFRPQTSGYLNSVPGPALWQAFQRTIQPYLSSHVVVNPVYLQAQRWGSGLPAPQRVCQDIEEICGTKYAKTLASSLVYDTNKAASDKLDFIAHDEQRLYYAGDFASHRNPGFEAAALSGFDLAQHMIETLK